MKRINEWIRSLTSGKKGSKILIFAGIAGIFLIFLSTLFPTAEKQKDKKSASSQTLESYTQELETRLEGIVGKINGVGRCQVLITMERGTEYIYAKEEKTTDDTSKSSGVQQYAEGSKSTGEQQYIIIDSDGGEQALLVTEIAPRVKGVIVVCEGGGNETVRNSVTNAVTTALDISSSKVCVSQKAIN